MAKQRVRARARKIAHAAAAAALERERDADEAQVIARGVFAVARDLQSTVTPGSLYWTAPNAYVAEQAAPRICRMAQLPAGREDDVAAYLHAALNEFLVSLVEGFDAEHFEAWSAAQRRQEEVRSG